MNNKELAAALRAIDNRQTECECRHYCCCGCECWDESCENECKILLQAADTLEKASDYEKILEDFSKVVNDGFQAMKEQKQNKPGWISVKDRLPGRYLKVLAYFQSGMIDTDFATEDGRFCFDGTRKNDRVTHWMPLPDPPEEVDK